MKEQPVFYVCQLGNVLLETVRVASKALRVCVRMCGHVCACMVCERERTVRRHEGTFVSKTVAWCINWYVAVTSDFCTKASPIGPCAVFLACISDSHPTPNTFCLRLSSLLQVPTALYFLCKSLSYCRQSICP